MPIEPRVPPLVARILTVLACILPVALTAHAVTFWGHGIIDSEAMEFVLNYLQRRPFFAQIFDPQINDWGAYQARELSYVFDLIDARAFAALLDRGVLIFVPLSGVIGLVAVGALYFWGARKVLALDSVTACLLLSLFLSCIVVQASTPILYRSSKIILCVALLAFLFDVFHLLKAGERRIGPLRITALFVLGLIMALCDRQGFYYLVSTTIIVLLTWLIAKTRRQSIERPYLGIIGANIAAIVATILYNRVFAPRLIHSLNGYWPDFTYQNLPVSTLLDPALPAKTLRIFFDQITFFFGNIPFFALALIAIALVVAFFWKRRSSIHIENITPIAVSLVTIFAVTGLLGTMIARHPAVYDVRDHEFWYYTLTVQVVILFGISAWLSLVDSERRLRFKPFLYLVVVILIGLNLSRYPAQRTAMIHSTGWFDSQYAQSQALVAQFGSDPPRREKIVGQSSDSFLDDQAHFLENVERSYLHLTGAIASPPGNQR